MKIHRQLYCSKSGSDDDDDEDGEDDLEDDDDDDGQGNDDHGDSNKLNDDDCNINITKSSDTMLTTSLPYVLQSTLPHKDPQDLAPARKRNINSLKSS